MNGIELTNEEYNAIIEARNEESIKLHSDIIEIYESAILADYSYLEEGANLEIREKFNKFKKDFKEENREFKKAFDDKDKKKCIKCLDNMDDIVDDVLKEIKAVKADNAGSVILGYFASSLMALGDTFIPTLNYVGAYDSSADKGLEIAFGIGAYIVPIMATAKGIVSWIKGIKQLIEDIEDSKKNKDLNVFNAYRGKIIIYVKDFKKNIEKFRV